MSRHSEALALGMDAGGTATRWALAGRDGAVRAQGEAPAIGGLQLLEPGGAAAIEAVLQRVAQGLPAAPRALWAGLTGFDPQAMAQLAPRLAAVFGLPAASARAMSDIELLCRSAFAPGQGIVVYAGTGSIGAHLERDGTLQRAGGRGAVIDDAGGGHWIAREALRAVWRAEDEAPGAWRRSALAMRLFDRIGGSTWADTRAHVYGATRGELGTLALAVAEAAGAGDAQALALLQRAGVELARLGRALLARVGVQPIVLAGRVFELHPAVEAALRAELPATAGPVQRLAEAPQVAAARAAARALAADGGA